MSMSPDPPGSPDRSIIQRIACTSLQSRSVVVDSLNGYIFRTYSLRTAKGFFYLLRLKPPSTVHLLRHEYGWLEAEAGALQALSGKTELHLPRLINYQHVDSHLGHAYLISGPFSGSLLSDVEPSLSSKALASIDRSLGQYVRWLSSITGTFFGSVSGGADIPRSASWAHTFACLLESVMRDGEDAMISLPYDVIRGLIHKHHGALNQITTPRILLLELASDNNVVVDTTSNRVTGLFDFSTCLWGDPYMSDCFCKPTASFVEGFGRLPNKTADERVRQYLYILYHAVLSIVRKWYRPRDEGDEMDARRTLTVAIRQLSS